MIAIPAVDLRDGSCVQLVGGSYSDERIRLTDPVAVAERWVNMGFRRLHVVDLDAAMQCGSNDAIVSEILSGARVDVQVGGGVRGSDRIARLAGAGARYIVIGTRAIQDRDWLVREASMRPNTLIVAADVRERQIVTHGWQTPTSLDVVDFVRDIATLPLAGVLVTAVHKEGLLGGADVPLMEAIVGASPIPVIASGGVTTPDDLTALGRAGVSAAVIGMALYTGALDPRLLVEEFSA